MAKPKKTTEATDLEMKAEAKKIGDELHTKLLHLALFEIVEINDSIWEAVPNGWIKTTNYADEDGKLLFVTEIFIARA